MGYKGHWQRSSDAAAYEAGHGRAFGGGGRETPDRQNSASGACTRVWCPICEQVVDKDPAGAVQTRGHAH